MEAPNKVDQALSPEEIAKLSSYAHSALELVLGFHDSGGRTGGYLSVFCEDTMFDDKEHGPTPEASLVVGTIASPEKRGKYWDFSCEKPVRIWRNKEKGHVSSFQSRNLSKQCFGGGIKADCYYIGFSGLPEHADEALGLIVAYLMRWISRDHLWATAVVSNNRIILDNKSTILLWSEGLM